MRIESATDYKKFKILKGNRPVVSGKVKKLVKSVQGGLNLFRYNPVMVNEDMYVIDGQHRLEACKVLKLPVYYVVVPKITLLQIAELNSASSRWTSKDFFNCFIESGKEDYKALKMFMEKYELKVTVAAQLLMVGSTWAGSGRDDSFRSGTFVVKHKDKAEGIMKTVRSFAPVAEDGIVSDRNFIRAVQLLMASPTYKHGEVLNKIVGHKLKITKRSSHKEYMHLIEELYNHRCSVRKRLFESTK